jgi:hypothetical protein
MKRILCTLLAATLAFGSALADAPKSKNEKVTLVYQHELPNVPGRASRAYSSNTARAATRLLTRMPNPPSFTRPSLRGRSAVRSTTDPVTTYKAGQSFSELPGSRHGVSANASETKPAKLLAVFVVDTNETELTTPVGN